MNTKHWTYCLCNSSYTIFPQTVPYKWHCFLKRSILFLFRTFNVTFEAWKYYILFSYFKNVVNIQQISFRTEHTLFQRDWQYNLYGTTQTYWGPSLGVIQEQFYIVSADGVGKGTCSAIWMAYWRQWDEQNGCQCVRVSTTMQMCIQFPRICAEVENSHAWFRWHMWPLSQGCGCCFQHLL